MTGGFVGTIVNTVTELSQTAYIHEVSIHRLKKNLLLMLGVQLPKDKQAAAAKSNIVQKQKALSDLFKVLKTIGTN